MNNWVYDSWPTGWPEAAFFIMVALFILSPIYLKIHDRIVEKHRYGVSLTDPKLSEEDVWTLVREQSENWSNEPIRADSSRRGVRSRSVGGYELKVSSSRRRQRHGTPRWRRKGWD